MRFLFIFFFLVSSNLIAQDAVITVNENRDYIVQEVTLQGKVDQVVQLTTLPMRVKQ